MYGRILGLDPGDKVTAYAILDQDRGPVEADIVPNSAIIALLQREPWTAVGIEWIRGYGLKVGSEVFETCVWCGEYRRECKSLCQRYHQIFRMDVKLSICHDSKANDSSVRLALMDRFGGEAAVQRAKKCSRKRHLTCGCGGTGILRPAGILAGYHDDMWAALGVAFTTAQMYGEPPF